MFLIRDVFRCKPGKAGALARMFQETIPSMERDDGFRNCRVMVDYVATYWTVVLQAEVDDIQQFVGHASGFGSRPEVQKALAGYMDLVEEGHREVWRILA